MTVRGFETADGRTVEHGQFGGFPEVGDLDAAAERLLDGAQDVSDGGLPQALVEGVPRYGTAARVALPFDLDPFEALFSDSGARAVTAVRAGAERRVREPSGATGVSYTAIGTTGGDALHVGDLFDVRLDGLRAVHEATLPVAFER
jgi:phosphoribosylformylglycinamidine (FGAM) synthase-like enzyme